MIKIARKMSLVLCNVGSTGLRSRGGSSSNQDQNCVNISGLTTRNSSSNIVGMPSSSVLNRNANGMHSSQSSSTLHQTTNGNDNNNNTNVKPNYNETDDPNQVTIYR